MTRMTKETTPQTISQTVLREATGLGQDLLTQKGQHNAFLGISLDKRFFSKKRISTYLYWAAEFCNSFVLLIDDYEERHNYRVFHNLDEAQATAKALKRGEELRKSFTRALFSLNPQARSRISLVKSSVLLKDPQCMTIMTHLISAYEDDPQFREDIHTQVSTNISKRIQKWRQNVSDVQYEQSLPIISQYLLEEIGVTIFLRDHRGYPTEVYPGSEMHVVANVYTNRYPHLSTALGLKPENYGHIHLDVADHPSTFEQR